MKIKKRTKIIVPILLIFICLVGIYIYLYVNVFNVKKTTYIICTIDDKEMIILNSKWIQDKVKATEANLLEYYDKYFKYPAGREYITRSLVNRLNVSILDKKGHKISWDDLRPGDELLITETLDITFAPLQNVKSIQITDMMVQGYRFD